MRWMPVLAALLAITAGCGVSRTSTRVASVTGEVEVGAVDTETAATVGPASIGSPPPMLGSAPVTSADGSAGPASGAPSSSAPTSTGGSSSSAPTADPPPTTVPPRRISMAFTGDFLLHNRVTGFAAEHAADDPTRDYDYRPLLEPIRPWIEGADWAVCHMEVNLSADGTRLRPFPMFRSPGQIAFDARDLGYDSCSVASNHILDHGIAGVNETLGVLDDASLDSTGAARTAEEARDQIWFDIGGVLVAHLSYAYGFNGFLIPDDAPWLTNQIAAERILADATRAREAGAEVVILSLHWGEQYQIPPNSQQRELGLSLLSSPDIDLIIGHHAHVAQTIEHQDGEWLVYGLGNLLANYSQAVRRDELLVEVTFTEQADGGFDSELMAVPLYVEWGTLTVYPSSPGGRSAGAGPALDAELDASWERVLDTLRSGSGWEHLLLG